MKHRSSGGQHDDVCGDEPPLRKKTYAREKGSLTSKGPSRSAVGKSRAKFKLRVKAAARVERRHKH